VVGNRLNETFIMGKTIGMYQNTVSKHRKTEKKNGMDQRTKMIGSDRLIANLLTC
jgi:hypothetical protein